MISRRAALTGLTIAAMMPVTASAETLNDHFSGLLGDDDAAFDKSITALRNHAKAGGGQELIHGLILALRYTAWRDQPILQLLTEVTGAAHDDWFNWMLWQEVRSEISAHDGYRDLKRDVFYGFDPRFDQFINDDHLAQARIRFEEITWGGVKTDGIPGLTRPRMIAARDADFMVGSDAVLGVSINGDTRAYPLRILAWHEMLNDVIGGVPVALPYCTLCNSGNLFEANISVDQPVEFATSGLLYRSNKLMWDSATKSLWNQFTGEPVIGPLAHSGLRLVPHPVVVEPWVRWIARNPDSTVLSLDTGYTRNYGSGYFYDRYIRSDDLIFPARADERRLGKKNLVFGISGFGSARAWPLTAFEGGKAINDMIGPKNIVLIGDRLGDTVRAFERGDQIFELRDGALISDNAKWQMTEEALIAPDGTRLRRIAGRTSYWFAWNNYEGAGASLYPD